MKTQTEFAKFIKRQTAKGVTKVRIAQEMGVHHDTVTRIEKGATNTNWQAVKHFLFWAKNSIDSDLK